MEQSFLDIAKYKAIVFEVNSQATESLMIYRVWNKCSEKSHGIIGAPSSFEAGKRG